MSQEERKYQTLALMVSALSAACIADPGKTVDKLTGYLWDTEEAEMIKKYLVDPVF